MDTAAPTNGEAMAVAELRALTASILSDRRDLARLMGSTFGGARNVYGVLGYDETITVAQYIERYRRGGVAKAIVDRLPKATWRGDMWLEENDDPNKVTKFEDSWDLLEERLKIKAVLQRVDILSRLSTYGVLLIGALGEPNSELPKGGPETLLYLKPFLGGGGPVGVNNSLASRATTQGFGASIAALEEDAKSPRYGLPLTYNLKDITVPVHWTRIIHISEGCLEDDVYGEPALEICWNDLDDLDKVKGGGSEAFWLRANAGIHMDLDKGMELKDEKNTVEALKAQFADYSHQLTRAIRTRGVTIEQLGSDVANFSGPADTIITLIAGSTGIPKRLLVGSEMGELASTQDRENFRDIVNGRQTGYAAPYIVRPLVDRLIEYGYLPKPAQYDVKWPHIEVLGEKEKSAGAQQWASTNQAQGDVVFTTEEIRDKWYAMPPLSDEQKQQIADEKAQKVKEAQEAMVAGQVPGAEDEEAEEEKTNPFARAAEDKELIRVLAAAIDAGATEVVEAIVMPRQKGTKQIIQEFEALPALTKEDWVRRV